MCSWGPIPWLLGAEVFPLRARAKGMALSTSVNWISNFIIAFITPPLFSALEGGYYFLLLGFAAISFIVVFFLYPETAGKTLEELGQVFGDHVLPVSVDAEEKGMPQASGVANVAEPPEIIEAALSRSRSMGPPTVDAALAPASELTLAGIQEKTSLKSGNDSTIEHENPDDDHDIEAADRRHEENSS